MKQKKVPIILVIYLLIFYLLGYAQEEKIHQYKVEVKEKLLYVLALDKDGNPVTDLKKEDFQLFVDGKPQKIDTFYLINHTIEKEIEKKKEIPKEKTKVPFIQFNYPKIDKRFTLAVIPFSFGSMRQRWRLEKSLEHLVEQAYFPEDWIGIVVIDRDRIYALQDFTCSKEKLLRKIDAYFKREYDQLSMLQKEYPTANIDVYNVPQLPLFQGIIPVGGIDIIPALDIIAEKVGMLNGRKILICFGLPLDFLGSNLRISAFFKMINKMLSYDITIYYSELKGPYIPSFFDASSSIKLSSRLLPGGTNYDPVSASLSHFSEESSHFALANETGGKYYYNISSPSYFIDDVSRINSSYYLISFPITLKLGKKESFKIRLKCKRKGVKLYYSNKYYAPHELEEKKFEDTYKKIQLFKYLVVDAEQPKLDIEGKWIPVPVEEEAFQLGFIDFYLPPEIFRKFPLTYQLGGSYVTSQRRGIFFQNEVEVSSSQRDSGYRARALVKFTGEGKSLRLVAMDSESGEYGKFDIDIGKSSKRSNFINIILGRLLEKDQIYEFRDYSEAMYNVKKEFYNLLSVNDHAIIPAVNNTFSAGENIAFCLIHKIPEEQAKRYKNAKVVAYLSLDKEGQITEINLPVRIKKVEKHYRQYYGTIDTSDLTPGKYRIEIDLKDANNSIITATDFYFKIIP